MGRGATKAAGNVYYEARVEAAKWNEKLLSREGAAEALGVSVDVMKSTELDLYKQMPVEVCVLMADLYNAPHLLNHYCIYECPIGHSKPISDKVYPIERVTVRLLKKLRMEQLDDVQSRLIDIAEDGEVTEGEIEDLKDIIDYLDDISETICELKNIGEQIVKRSYA